MLCLLYESLCKLVKSSGSCSEVGDLTTLWLPDTRNQDFNAGRKFYAIDFFIDPLGLDADYRLSKICKTLSRERLHCTYY